MISNSVSFEIYINSLFVAVQQFLLFAFMWGPVFVRHLDGHVEVGILGVPD